MKAFKNFFILGGISYLSFVIPFCCMLEGVEDVLKAILMAMIPFIMVFIALWRKSKFLHQIAQMSMLIGLAVSFLFMMFVLSGEANISRWASIPFAVAVFVGMVAVDEYSCRAGIKDIIECL